MAGVAARFCSILIDEFDFSTDSAGGAIEIPVEAQEAATLQMTALAQLPTVPGMAKLTHSGYYSGVGAGKIEQEMYARLGTATPAYVAALLDTTSLANPAYVFAGSWGSQLKINMPAKELITLEGEWAANPVRRGDTLQNGSFAAGVQTSQDFGVAGSNGCTAYLFVRSITGTATTITVQLQGSTAAGFSTPVTLGTWTNFTTVGCKVLTVAPGTTIQRYLRLNVSSLVGATAFAACAIVCVPGVTE